MKKVSVILGSAIVALMLISLTGCKMDLGFYSVTFDSNGGSRVTTQTVLENKSATPLAENPTKTGFTFVGWSLENPPGDVWSFNTPITKNIVLYAIWSGVYTINFETDGGSQVPQQSVLEDEKATRPDTDPTKAGYTFDGWYTDSTPATPWDFDTPINGHTVLYAVWTAADNTLSFNPNGGSGSMVSQTVKSGETTTLPETTLTNAEWSVADNAFAGWATTPTGKAEYANEAEFPMGNADVTLYAKWKIDETTLRARVQANKDVSIVDTSLVTDMNSLFEDQTAFNQDISGWDVSNVTNMESMFEEATNFNQDISEWDVSKVTTMKYMFEDATNFNQDISSWDVSSVTSMNSMFEDAKNFNQDLTDWNVSSVKYMEEMFYGATNFNGDLSNWVLSSVTDMDSMFEDAINFDQDLSDWFNFANIPDGGYKIKDMGDMFYGAINFNEDISGWDVSSVIDMNSMFEDAINFNGDISGWDVSSVTNMGDMFNGASAFDQDISGWDVSKVTTMYNMFEAAINFNQNLSDWDVSSVLYMPNMFNGASSFNQDLSGWDVSNVTLMDFMFNGASSFNGDLSDWDVGSVTDMSYMFSDATAFNQNISSWFNKVPAPVGGYAITNMTGMFNGASSFNQNLSGWDVSSVTSNEDFYKDSGLAHENIPNGFKVT